MAKFSEPTYFTYNKISKNTNKLRKTGIFMQKLRFCILLQLKNE